MCEYTPGEQLASFSDQSQILSHSCGEKLHRKTPQLWDKIWVIVYWYASYNSTGTRPAYPVSCIVQWDTHTLNFTLAHTDMQISQSLTDLSGPSAPCQFVFIGQQNGQAPCWKLLRHVCHLGKHALATTMNPADKLDSDCEHRSNILVQFWQSLTHLGQISHTL